ncbi:hypothetical protein PM082_019155 [Marasmius tenuissimus]|nr:hypothetical protein PM082_019155 [Marasmius tenuissimus]
MERPPILGDLDFSPCCEVYRVLTSEITTGTIPSRIWSGGEDRRAGVDRTSTEGDVARSPYERQNAAFESYATGRDRHRTAILIGTCVRRLKEWRCSSSRATIGAHLMISLPPHRVKVKKILRQVIVRPSAGSRKLVGLAYWVSDVGAPPLVHPEMVHKNLPEPSLRYHLSRVIVVLSTRFKSRRLSLTRKDKTLKLSLSYRCLRSGQMGPEGKR